MDPLGILADGARLLLTGDYVGGSFQGYTEEDSAIVDMVLTARDWMDDLVSVGLVGLLILLVVMLIAGLDETFTDTDNEPEEN